MRERAMMGDKSWNQWVGEYALSHQNPINKLTHLLGIPMIVTALPLLALAPFVDGLWRWGAGLFVAGWALQFIGHVFEGKAPEFFKDWRFLFVGVRWWVAKIAGRA
jgi:uncharacterized membrane protein YGL010W